MLRAVASVVGLVVLLAPMASSLCVTTCHEPEAPPCHRSEDAAWQARAHDCEHGEASAPSLVRRADAPTFLSASVSLETLAPEPIAVGSLASEGLTLLPGFDPPAPALRI